MVRISQTHLRSLLTGYLAQHGLTLHEYSGRPGVFYFDVPREGGQEHYADVVFDRDRAVDNDGLTYLHLNHPLVRSIVRELTDDEGLQVAHLQPRRPLPGAVKRPCLWGTYRLRMTNYEDVDRREVVSVCIDATGERHPRLARALLEVAAADVQNIFVPPNALALEGLQQEVREAAETLAHEIFANAQLEHARRLEIERAKVVGYYRQQEAALESIAIENIRRGKRRELLERRQEELARLDRRLTLVPELEPIGLAIVMAHEGG
jgi:hypothetical protein